MASAPGRRQGAEDGTVAGTIYRGLGGCLIADLLVWLVLGLIIWAVTSTRALDWLEGAALVVVGLLAVSGAFYLALVILSRTKLGQEQFWVASEKPPAAFGAGGELVEARRSTMSDCIFCQIVAKEIPADLVYEDGEVVAFRDINPQAPVHLLIIPRKHISGLAAAGEAEVPILGRLAAVAAELARKEGLEGGYRLVVNNGPDAGQAVNHLHYHLLGGRKMSWPPG